MVVVRRLCGPAGHEGIAPLGPELFELVVAAALGAILLGVVLLLYYTYDKIVGIDNVKLGG